MTRVSYTVEGLDGFLRAMNGAPKQTKTEFRKRARAIAEPVAQKSRALAVGGRRQLAAVAPTMKAKSDRVPTIVAGGARRATSSGAKAGELIFGSEFGSNRFPQFPRRNPNGNAIYPAIEASRQLIAEQFLDAIEEVFQHGAR